MDKKGRESIMVAVIIVFTVLLVGVVLVLKAAGPTGGAVSDFRTQMEITDFNAVYNPDRTVSMKFVANVYEPVSTGLTGTFRIRGESLSGFFDYTGTVFFDGAFAELQGLASVDDLGEFKVEGASGILVVTNAIDGTATIMGRIDFLSPLFRGGPIIPEDLLVTVEYINHDKSYYGFAQVPFRERATSLFNYYTVYDGFIEIEA